MYFCKECNHFHKKKNSVIYKEHKKHDAKLSASEIQKKHFQANWNRLVKEYKKTGRAIGLPK